MRRTLAHLMCLAGFVVTLLGVPGAQTPSAFTSGLPTQSGRGQVATRPLTPAEIFAAQSKTVAVIQTLDAAGDPVARGSGVLVSAGVLATNAHVIHGAVSATAQIAGISTPIVSVLYVDDDADVCLLAVSGPARALASAHLAAGLPPIGSRAVAIGNPLGFNLTVTEGIISGYRDTPHGPRIQTSAAIGPGSSGGALFDEQANLIGLTTSSFDDAQNLNFAVSVTTITEALTGSKMSPALTFEDANSRFTVRAVLRAENAIRTKNRSEIEAAARAIADGSPGDPRALVCTAVSDFYAGDFAAAQAVAERAADRGGELNKAWLRTWVLVEARSVYASFKAGHTIRGDVVRIIDGFLDTRPPSLFSDAEDAGAVVWARTTKAELLIPAGRWSDTLGTLLLGILKPPLTCELAGPPFQVQINCGKAGADPVTVRGTLSIAGDALEGSTHILFSIGSGASVIDSCLIDMSLRLSLASDGDSLTGRLSAISIIGGRPGGANVACEMVKKAWGLQDRPITLHRIEQAPSAANGHKGTTAIGDRQQLTTDTEVKTTENPDNEKSAGSLT